MLMPLALGLLIPDMNHGASTPGTWAIYYLTPERAALVYVSMDRHHAEAKKKRMRVIKGRLVAADPTPLTCVRLPCR
jgi:hypothetical protein